MVTFFGSNTITNITALSPDQHLISLHYFFCMRAGGIIKFGSFFGIPWIKKGTLRLITDDLVFISCIYMLFSRIKWAYFFFPCISFKTYLTFVSYTVDWNIKLSEFWRLNRPPTSHSRGSSIEYMSYVCWTASNLVKKIVYIYIYILKTAKTLLLFRGNM